MRQLVHYGQGADILSPDAVDFVIGLDREFARPRQRLLETRRERSDELLAGGNLDLLAGTRALREDRGWRVPPPPPDLADRRVEIASPADNRKVVINALNSGAQIWVADLEDSTAPTWPNLLLSQLNLRDSVKGTISHVTQEGRSYRLEGDLPAIVVRPRGWHLSEPHLAVDGHVPAAAIVDFGLYLFHCARRQVDRGSGPYFYLPKLEGSADAQLWADVFEFAQDALRLPRGTIRATALIEDVRAAHEMPEILHALGPHATGLTAGRWDYLFSIVKYFRLRPEFVLPDRDRLTMTVPFMQAYTALLIQCCHDRGAHAIGGVATQLPDRHDPVRNHESMTAVALDKRREAAEGFDGAWVVHPDLVPICRAAFDETPPDRIDRPVAAAALTALDGVEGLVTLHGLTMNIAVSVRYLAAWLRGRGSVKLFGLMEGLATVEIARAQVWQWSRHRVRLEDGTVVTDDLVRTLVEAEVAGDAGLRRAADLFETVALAPDFPDFLTLPGYEQLERET